MNFNREKGMSNVHVREHITAVEFHQDILDSGNGAHNVLNDLVQTSKIDHKTILQGTLGCLLGHQKARGIVLVVFTLLNDAPFN